MRPSRTILRTVHVESCMYSATSAVFIGRTNVAPSLSPNVASLAYQSSLSSTARWYPLSYSRWSSGSSYLSLGKASPQSSASYPSR